LHNEKCLCDQDSQHPHKPKLINLDLEDEEIDDDDLLAAMQEFEEMD